MTRQLNTLPSNTPSSIDLSLIERTVHAIQSDTQGIVLQLVNKRRRDIAFFDGAHTLVMVHGATYSSGSLYDVPLGGYSLMDFLAHQGFDVYALDVRGYGGSSRLPEMTQPAEASEPLVRTEVGVRDLASAVDFVRGVHNGEAVNVLGMSWGGSVAGAYASGHSGSPEATVRKLVLVAPQWLSTTPVPIDAGGKLDGYRHVTIAGFEAHWRGAAPESDQASLIPERWFGQWAKATIDTETDSAVRARGQIRATNGAILDIREYWTKGRPFYQPRDIQAPVLLIHGEWDRDVPLALAQALFSQLTGASSRRWLEIGKATHMLLLERGRRVAFDAISAFLAEEDNVLGVASEV